MVIAKCLRSLRHSSLKSATHAKTNTLCLGPLAAAVKLKFNNLSGLFRCGHELPFLERVLARLHKQGVAANDAGGFHAAVRSDYHFDLHFAADVHTAGKLRIGRSGP